MLYKVWNGLLTKYEHGFVLAKAWNCKNSEKEAWETYLKDLQSKLEMAEKSVNELKEKIVHAYKKLHGE